VASAAAKRVCVMKAILSINCDGVRNAASGL
jgi:hypothetical protein